LKLIVQHLSLLLLTQVYHRVLGSSTTGGITTYLNAACPAVWGITQVLLCCRDVLLHTLTVTL
jgi:hypothetical protein